MSHKYPSLMLVLPVAILWAQNLAHSNPEYSTLAILVGIPIAAWHIKILLTLCYHRGALRDALEREDKQAVGIHLVGLLGLKVKKEGDDG